MVTNERPVLIVSYLSNSDTPSDWLSKRTQHPIRDLLYIHIGLGSQSFQLEFNNDGILYTVAVRDKQWCEKFVSQLTGKFVMIVFDSFCAYFDQRL